MGTTARDRPEAGPRSGVVLAAALALVAAASSNALQGPFVWDDRELILRAPLVQRLDVGAHLGRAFWDRSAAADADPSYFRPLTSLTYAVDWRLWGGQPVGFHLTNVLLHLGVTALVYRLARRGGAPPLAAGLAAALFGVFPRLTESVTWVSGRTDLLAGGLALGALLLHGDGTARPARRAGAAALAFLGLLAKEVAAAALVGVVAVEVAAALRRQKTWRAAAAACVPAGLAGALYGGLRLQALAGGPSAPLPDHPHRAWMPLQALGRYALMLLDPRPNLRIGMLGVLEPAPLAAGLLVVALAAVGLVRLARRRPSPALAGLAATGVAALALVLHLVRIPVTAVAADRFLYLPLACLAPLAAAALASMPWPPRRVLAGAAAAAALAFAGLTAWRNEDWSDELRLWRRAVETASPADPIPRTELGNALSRAGRHEEALAAYREAHALMAGRLGGEPLRAVLGNLASTLSNLGRLEEARGQLVELMAQEPDRPVNHYNLAVIDTRLLQLDRAEAGFDRALRLLPDYPDARRGKALLADVRRMVAGLPAERPDEPTPVLVQRARLWTQLAVPARAAPLWAGVAARADAPLAAVEEAAAYLLAAREPLAAQVAVARAIALGLPAERREALQAGLRELPAR